ncbi:hypothetical protein QJQ45_006493 [Haematococcus lacustris]|nr:hypothetical protein QJQ45_006493 [Haematococcus lacustris]
MHVSKVGVIRLNGYQQLIHGDHHTTLPASSGSHSPAARNGARTTTQREQSDGLLFPALPSLLIGSRIAAASYGSELSRGGTYTFQPRAQLDNPGSKTSTAQPRPPPRDTSRPAEGLRLRLPNPASRALSSARELAEPLSSTRTSSPSEPRRVLILMSNTGGGHKASAEAIRDAFKQKHGDGYKIDIIDMWKDHTPAPFNRMPDSYSFLVSVHPLMQHVPIRVIKERIRNGTSPAINFATVSSQAPGPRQPGPGPAAWLVTPLRSFPPAS